MLLIAAALNDATYRHKLQIPKVTKLNLTADGTIIFVL